MNKAILYKKEQLNFDNCVTMTLKGWGFSGYFYLFLL